MVDISTVNSDDIEKEKRLQERRQKVANWKLKKAEFDKKSKAESDTQSVTKDGLEAPDQNKLAKLLERQRKLDDWKRKKREREELPRNVTEEPTMHPEKKMKKPKKRGILLFDESDEEYTDDITTIYNPLNDQNNDEIIFTNVNSNDDNMDSLENFMVNVIKEPKSNAKLFGIVVDDENDEKGINQGTNSSDNDEDNESSSQYKKIAKLKSRKIVKGITYKKDELEPFKKNFYVQTEELTKMSDEEVEELRLSMSNTKVKGKGCPKPITRWSQLGLPTNIMNLILKELKYETPTAIQAQALPAIMSGRDVIGISKTGSGKTISYILPLLRQIKAQRPLDKEETGPLGLILAPTRELAVQIHVEVEKFTSNDIGFRSICCTGGSELKKQINELKRGVEIVVATPGRFIDLLTLNTGKLISTKRITFVVMDEADRLFDMGFEPQITQIMKTVRPDKQCILFSATFPNKLRSFATRVLRDPLCITINSENLVNENVTQKLEICNSESEKFDKLVSILEEFFAKEASTYNESINRSDRLELADDNENEVQDKKIIIFVSSQQICDHLYTQIENYDFDTYAIHAGKPYQERIQNLERFKRTKNSILLCTEVLSRGLNVPEVSLVIIYNAVKTFAQYVHTTGRTARGLNKGDAVTLLLPNEIPAAYILQKAMRQKELDNHDQSITKTLMEMSYKFELGLKEGKFKLSKGFGGKGLDNLDIKREEKQIEERRLLEGTTESNNMSKSNKAGGQISENVDESTAIQIPKLQFTVQRDNNHDSGVTYSAKVNVNDLPQLVRWEATKNTTLMFIKHETGCSITNRGKFYPEGKGPKTDKEEPKLYLLIEAKEEKDIILSIDLLEQKVKEGLRKVEYQSIKSNKY